MKYDIVKKCSFLATDSILLPERLHRAAYPAVNHVLAYNYAVVLEPLLCFEFPDRDAKPASLIYLKMFCHTAKHMLHKYNRNTAGTCKYRVWGISDFNTEKTKLSRYVEYPRIEDMLTLKREVMNRTPIKVNNYDLDVALNNINLKALGELAEYSMMEFHKDFELANFFWGIMIDYMLTVREKESTKTEEKDKENR